MDTTKWKQFEELVTEIQRELAPDCVITPNDKIIGKRTGVSRQIDISVRKHVGQFEILVVLDCRDYARPLDVKDVEEFMGLAQDVGAHQAAMVSARGYSETAKKRAQDAGIELFRAVDTGDHPWKVAAFAPALCEFTGIRGFSLTISATGYFSMRTDIDHREMELFGLDEKSLGTVKDLLYDAWNRMAFPEQAGFHKNLEFVQNPVKIQTDGNFHEINVLVEAKSRHRAGVMAQPGTWDLSPNLRFRGLINDAVAKDPNNPLAIFVDTNLPPDRAHRFYTPRSTNPIVPSMAMSALMERVRKDYGGVDPYNLLVFSNHPQHYPEDDEAAPANRWAGFITQNTRVPVYHQQALLDLFKAVNLYGNVPTDFPPGRDQQ